MFPSFFKKLGPINSDLIKSSIDCKIVNVSNDDYFDNFVSINNVSNNTLSFIYDNEKIEDNLSLTSGIICTEKTANKLNPNQKNLLLGMFKSLLRKYQIFSIEIILKRKKQILMIRYWEKTAKLVIMSQLKMVQ